MNLAVFIMIILYIGICALVVGYWAFGTIGRQDKSIQERLDIEKIELDYEGKAFVKETSVEELKHYAEDAGKSKEEIAKITEPKLEMSFEASGVLMKK